MVSENVSRETISFNTVFNMVKNFSEGFQNVENLFSFPVGIMWKTFRRRQTAADKPPNFLGNPPTEFLSVTPEAV